VRAAIAQSQAADIIGGTPQRSSATPASKRNDGAVFTRIILTDNFIRV
jgi:hypothetical protein